MQILVLGGTVFLSKAIAAEAVRRGHEVVCACRGTSGPVPEGARLVRWDRAAGERAPDVAPDAVVDVARHPSWVRAAVAAWPGAHWTFVSTVNVYADNATPGQGVDAALVEAILTDEEMTAPEIYGGMKVGCEQLVAAGAAAVSLVRPGLIVGPGDPSGRFTYWPERLAEGGEALAGGGPDDTLQVIDVRDLASWIVDGAEARLTGTFNGVGPVSSSGRILADVAAGVGAEPALTWVPDEFLVEQDVEPWAGERGLPLWLPRPEYDGMAAHDDSASVAAGLTTRPVAETARDTLAWLADTPDATRTGLSREAEVGVLTAWNEQRVRAERAGLRRE